MEEPVITTFVKFQLKKASNFLSQGMHLNLYSVSVATPVDSCFGATHPANLS